MLLVALVTCASLQAQESKDFGIFSHLGAGISAGTEGLSFSLASPVTNYLEVGFGVNYMPGIKIKGDVDMNINTSSIPPQLAGYVPKSSSVKITGDLERTSFDFKTSIYPFGKKNAFFVAAGLSFGGDGIAKLTGSNELIRQHPELRQYIVANIDKYNLKFDDNGDINADVRVGNARPYLGLGYGRLVPTHRVGFRVELGCQYMGKIKIYQNGSELSAEDFGSKGENNISKIVDKARFYPVLKLTLTGRLF